MNFNQPGFLSIDERRPLYLYILSNEYSQIIYTDIDTVWMKDPRPYFKGKFDYWGQIDGILVDENLYRYVLNFM